MSLLLAQAQQTEQVGALNNTVLVALIVALGSLASTGILAYSQGRREHKRLIREAEIRAKEKKEDWDRQDEVARRAEAAAARVVEVAEAAATTAQLLKERQDAAAAAAVKAKEDLIEANEKVRKETRRAAEIVNGKLDQIHTLVNSNLSEAMSERLIAIRALIVALRRAEDQSPEALQRIRQLDATAIELEAQLEDRKRQTKVAEAQVEQGLEGGIRAEWESPPLPPPSSSGQD